MDGLVGSDFIAAATDEADKTPDAFGVVPGISPCHSLSSYCLF